MSPGRVFDANERVNCWDIGLTNGGVKSTETRVTEILLEK